MSSPCLRPVLGLTLAKSPQGHSGALQTAPPACTLWTPGLCPQDSSGAEEPGSCSALVRGDRLAASWQQERTELTGRDRPSSTPRPGAPCPHNEAAEVLCSMQTVPSMERPGCLGPHLAP